MDPGSWPVLWTAEAWTCMLHCLGCLSVAFWLVSANENHCGWEKGEARVLCSFSWFLENLWQQPHLLPGFISPAEEPLPPRSWLLGEEGRGDHHSSSSSVLDGGVLSGSGRTTSQLPLPPRGEKKQPSSHSNFLLLLISELHCLYGFPVAPSPAYPIP